jgi:hypothetical protein
MFDAVIYPKTRGKVHVVFETVQAQKMPKVFGCVQIISLLNIEQNYLT